MSQPTTLASTPTSASQMPSSLPMGAACAVPSQPIAPVQVPGNQSAAGQAPGWVNAIFLVGVVVFLWLFVFRPQAKRAKEQKTFLESLTSGLEVVSAAGIVGIVEDIQDTTITLKTASHHSIRVLKSSVSSAFNAGTTTASDVTIVAKK